MNMKRMADQYRKQLSDTGETARRRLVAVVEKSEYGHPDSARRYLGVWYHQLKKGGADEKSLADLQKALENTMLMKRIYRKSDYDFYGTPEQKVKDTVIENDERLAKIALSHLDRFLAKLPRLIEKNLRRSVREAGL